MNTKSKLMASAGGLILAVVLSACTAQPTATPTTNTDTSNDSQPVATAMSSTSPSGDKMDSTESSGSMMVQENAVTLKGYKFSPATLKVKKGTTVTWENQDDVKHTVTSDTGKELGSQLIGKGEKYTHTFNTVGTFSYHCSPHPNMKATIEVTE